MRQAFKDYYNDLKERCRRDPIDGGTYDTQREDETFMAEFELPNIDYASRLLNAIHSDSWDSVEHIKQSLWDECRICLDSKLNNTGPEEIVI